MPNPSEEHGDNRPEAAGTEPKEAFSPFGIEPIAGSGNSGSDFFRQSFSDSPWQSPGQRTQQTLETHKAALVFDVLRKIQAGERIDLPTPRYGETGLAELMADSGLIEIRSEQDYARWKRTAREIDTLERDIAKAAEDIETAQPTVADLTEKHSRRFRNAWMLTFHSDKLNDERRQLRENQARIDAAQIKLVQFKQQRDQLGYLMPVLDCFVPSSQGYLAMTEAGEALLERLGQDADTLADMTLGEYYTPEAVQAKAEQTAVEPDDAFAAVESPRFGSGEELRLTEKMQLLSEIFQHLTEHESLQPVPAEDHPYLLNLSLVLSLRHNDLSEAVEDADTVIDYLLDFDLAQLEGFNVAAELLAKGLPVERAIEKHQELFVYMTDECGHRAGVTTAVEAAALSCVEGDLDQKIELQNQFRYALAGNGWIYGSHPTCYIAAKLSEKLCRGGRYPDEAAEEHRNLELAFIAAGLEDEVDLGYAALLLLDEPGANEVKAQRLNEAYHALVNNGFSADCRLYTVAARIAALENDPRETAEQVAEIRDKLKQGAGIDDQFGAISFSLLTNEYKVLPVIDKSSPNASRRSRAGKEHLRED